MRTLISVSIALAAMVTHAYADENQPTPPRVELSVGAGVGLFIDFYDDENVVVGAGLASGLAYLSKMAKPVDNQWLLNAGYIIRLDVAGQSQGSPETFSAATI